MSIIKQFVSHDPTIQERNRQIFCQMRMIENFDKAVKNKSANGKFVKLSQVGPNDFVIEIVRETGKRYYQKHNRFVPIIFNMTRLLAFSGGMRVLR